MDENRKKLAKKYEKIKLITGLCRGSASFILLFLFIALGYSKSFGEFSAGKTSNPYTALLLFIFGIGLFSFVIFSPFDYFFGYRLEHKFGLSNLTFGKWALEGLKSAAVGIVIGTPVVLLFYYMLLNYELWWLWTGCIILVYSVILAQLAPVIIFPLFYKFTPLENESLRERIKRLSEKAGFRIRGVFSFNMSKTTKKANAAFTGIGKTKRIILGDTLLSGFTEDEIETVFAHELGHYKRGHIRKSILISVFTTLGGLFIVSYLYSALYPLFGFQNRWDIGALPLIALIGGVLGFITKPASTSISRKFEFEADRFAVETTKNIDSFRSMMEKLAFQNLSDDEPNRLVEFWFRSHPSAKRRIRAGEKFYKDLKI